jgi:uncharacterized membrane protein YccC
MLSKLHWRLEWSIRTAISTSLIVYLALDERTRNALTYSGKHLSGPAFAAFVTIMVKDSTVGATLKNSFSCLIGSSIATLSAFVSILFVRYILPNESSKKIKYFVFLCILFILSAIYQYAEFHPMGKKLAISLLTLNFLVFEDPSPSECWRYLGDVALGTVCALVGTLIPSPIFASSELEVQAVLCSQVKSYMIAYLLETSNQLSL